MQHSIILLYTQSVVQGIVLRRLYSTMSHWPVSQTKRMLSRVSPCPKSVMSEGCRKFRGVPPLTALHRIVHPGEINPRWGRGGPGGALVVYGTLLHIVYCTLCTVYLSSRKELFQKALQRSFRKELYEGALQGSSILWIPPWAAFGPTHKPAVGCGRAGARL